MAKASQETGIPTQGQAPGQGNGSSETAMPSGAEIETAKAAVGVVQQRNQAVMQSFMNWMVERATTTDEDQFNVMASIVSEILASNSPAELLAERSAVSGRDIVGQALLLHGFELRAGDFEDSMVGHYAAMTMSRPGSEETRIVTCGGMKILAKLYKLDEFDEWPQVVVFTEKKTSKGYGVLDMVSPA